MFESSCDEASRVVQQVCGASTEQDSEANLRLAESARPATMSAPEIVSVAVPEGAVAGTVIQVQAPSGAIQVAVPEGVKPGQVIQVAV